MPAQTHGSLTQTATASKSSDGVVGHLKLTGQAASDSSLGSLNSGDELTTLSDGESTAKYVPGFDFSSMSKEKQKTFLTQLFTTGGHDLFPDDPLPTLAFDRQTCKNGIAEMFEANPEAASSLLLSDGVTRRVKGRGRLVRHAESGHNTQEDLGPDTKLTARGHGQAEDMGGMWNDAEDANLWKPNHLDLVSTLRRCEQTRSHISKAPGVWAPIYQENPTQYFKGVQGPSSVAKDAVFTGQYWGGPEGHGTTKDLFGDVFNESEKHMHDIRNWQGIGCFGMTAVEYALRTGETNPNIGIFGHADWGRGAMRKLRTVNGKPAEHDDIENGLFNTQTNEFEIWFDVNDKDEISIAEQDNGELVTFHEGFIPEFGKEYRAHQIAHAARQKAAKLAWEQRMSSQPQGSKSSSTASIPTARLSAADTRTIQDYFRSLLSASTEVEATTNHGVRTR